jgi:hypothetical protein
MSMSPSWYGMTMPARAGARQAGSSGASSPASWLHSCLCACNPLQPHAWQTGPAKLGPWQVDLLESPACSGLDHAGHKVAKRHHKRRQRLDRQEAGWVHGPKPVQRAGLPRVRGEGVELRHAGELSSSLRGPARGVARRRLGRVWCEAWRAEGVPYTVRCAHALLFHACVDGMRLGNGGP